MKKIDVNWSIVAAFVLGIFVTYSMVTSSWRSNGVGDWCLHMKHVVVCNAEQFKE